jgi:iron-sulfur cluster insertion protein
MSSEMTSINLSSNAVKRIQGLLPSQKSNYFRVYVTGGGCSGFQYGFKFDDSPEGDDDVVDFNGFMILLDSLSYPYLYGSTLDYVEDLSGSRFLVTNPNAKTTCGCGESFTI